MMAWANQPSLQEDYKEEKRPPLTRLRTSSIDRKTFSREVDFDYEIERKKGEVNEREGGGAEEGG